MTADLEYAGKFTLAVGHVTGVLPTQSNHALLQVAQGLVDIHTLLLYRLVGHGSPFQSLLLGQNRSYIWE